MPLCGPRRMKIFVPPWTRGDYKGVMLGTSANLPLPPSLCKEGERHFQRSHWLSHEFVIATKS